MRNRIKKVIALLMIVMLTAGLAEIDFAENSVQADSESQSYLGSLADKVQGTWSYEANGTTYTETNASLFDDLPTLANKGTTRWTTDNYDENSGAIDVGDFATSMMWNYSSDAFGNSVYAVPLSYKGTSSGVYVTKPSTILVDGTLMMEQPENGSLTDFIVGTDYTFASTKVDKVTGWSYDVVMENTTDASKYMKTTMTQGSPFAFFELEGSTVATVKRMNDRKSLPSEITYYNESSLEDSTVLILRVYDNQDLSAGYSSYDYYALYVPEGTAISQSGTDSVNGAGDLTLTFPSEDKAYFTFAWLCESDGTDDATAKKIAEIYQGYAYNFVTDTVAIYTYEQSTGTVNTVYSYTVDRKAESTKDGTIMGIIPHQYKYMSGYTYLGNTARTIRGTMYYLEGSSYETNLTYSGVLPNMPDIDVSDYDTLQEYVDSFMEEYGPTDTELTKESYDENTYDTGKKLNRAIQVMEAAETCGDTETAQTLLEAVERELADWFTYSGDDDEKYFYYDDKIGSLFGFPQSYYTVDGMTDHHFHYGYFVNAAAQVTLRDSTFADKYSNVVDELIADYATAEETNADSRYPYLRYFSTWEGHSWASGHANFADGNDQESSSEAISAWAGIILYGEATENSELTELGVCLYQTEISSVNCYWYDVDGDVLDENYKQTQSSDSTLPKYCQASMVWGGKYTYATWWTAEPMQIQGINLLPMTATSFYQSANKDYILTNWETALLNESSYTGTDKADDRWNEIWSEYLALADPDAALEYFDDECEPEAGESKAHCYHYIMALDKVGTPDLTITSDCALSSAFVDEDGVATYVAYNASSQAKTVTFSDGTEITAEPGVMTEVSDSEVAGKAKYTIKHYLQNSDGNYILFQTESKTAKIGNTVTATAKTYTGYELNSDAEGTVDSGVVAEDGSLTLCLYYNIVKIGEMDPSADSSLYTSLGSYNGYSVSYYVMKDDFGIANIQLLDGGMTFYVVYSADYNSTNTSGYLNNTEANSSILQGVYNLNLSKLTPDTYNTIRIESGSKTVYIVVKYGDPTGSPDLSDYPEETTTADPNTPTEVSGLSVGCPGDNTVSVTFRETDSQKEKGQTYNIYVDDEIVLSGVAAGTYVVENIDAGTHTVKVTAVLNGTESDGASATVRITGETATTETTTKQDSTTTASEATTGENTTTATSEGSTGENVTTAMSEGINTDETTSEISGTANASDTTEETALTGASEETTAKANIKVKKTKVKKAVKKKAKKVKISLKKVKKATKYQIKISKKKKFKKKNIILKKTVGKRKFTVKSKKLKNKKKLYIKARAIRIVNGKKYYSKWSKKKKIKIKK